MELYEASLSNVLRIVLWLILISFIIRLVARLALPIVIKKAEQRMRENQSGQTRSHQPPRKEGEVTVEKNGDRSGNTPRDGDYVDYVEIRE